MSRQMEHDSGSRIVLGIDVGGTFTDVLALDPATGAIVATFKLPSTPDNPANAALSGVARFTERTGSTASAVFHGTTVGTNTLIERRGARTALVATRGFRDVLALRRQARPRLYDLRPVVSEPLAERQLRFEAHERTLFDGSIETALSDHEVRRLVDELKASGVESIAISLLHAYANDTHERLLADAIKERIPGAYVTLSSDVCREFREFERTSTTTVNAYIGPVVARYIEDLEAQLQRRAITSLAITKSNGGLTSAANAKRFPVHLIESGPAAGVIATAALGQAEAYPNLIAFDMGGTTAKVGVVVNGEPRLSTEFYADRFVDGRDVGGYPIMSPVIDIIEIGAGGGSLARIDRAGVMKVGPESAGAAPGPAAYGKGGERPTVTDAHVVLGHIAADGFGNEDVRIEPDRAAAAIDKHLAVPLGQTTVEAALGVLRLATANMAEMVRLATLRRGLDPRDFALVAFGGAGPLHACEIAREVGIPKVVIPIFPGLFSALGTLQGERRHDLVQTYLRRIANAQPAALEQGFVALSTRAKGLIDAERSNGDTAWTSERRVDLRFEGQLFELTVGVPNDAPPSPADLERKFRQRHVEVYGYDLPEHGVEIVNLRLVVRASVWQGATKPGDAGEEKGHRRRRRIWTDDNQNIEIDAIARQGLAPETEIMGPVIIEDFGATIRVLDGQTVKVRDSGVLEIEVKHAAQA